MATTRHAPDLTSARSSAVAVPQVPFGIVVLFPVKAKPKPAPVAKPKEQTIDALMAQERAKGAGAWHAAGKATLPVLSLYRALSDPVVAMFCDPAVASAHLRCPITVDQAVDTLRTLRRFHARAHKESPTGAAALRQKFGQAISCLEHALSRCAEYRTAAAIYPGDDAARRAYAAGMRGDLAFERKLSKPHRIGEQVFFVLGFQKRG